MKTRAGYKVEKFDFGIGWRILDETGEVDTRPNGVVEISEPEVLVWEMLSRESGAEIPEITAAIKEKFSMNKEDAAETVNRFYDYLCQHRFIEGVEPRRF